MQPYTDATGEVDYGNIDEFYLADEHYYLSGDWGKLKIKSSPLRWKFKTLLSQLRRQLYEHRSPLYGCSAPPALLVLGDVGRDPGSDRYWTRLDEQYDAASTHNNPYTPSQLRQELKKNGTVPRRER